MRLIRLIPLLAAIQLVALQTPGADTKPPNASFVSLRMDDLVGGAMTVNINATDDDAVTRVALFKDGQLVTNILAAPYAGIVDFNTDIPGRRYKLAAEAIDPSGNVGRAEVEVLKPSESLRGPGATPVRNGVFFEVWAPHARNVRLAGDVTN